MIAFKLASFKLFCFLFFVLADSILERLSTIITFVLSVFTDDEDGSTFDYQEGHIQIETQPPRVYGDGSGIQTHIVTSTLVAIPGGSGDHSTHQAHISPTPTLPHSAQVTLTSEGGQSVTFHPLGSNALPEEKFLIRTVLRSNMTIIHKGIEGFKDDMESKLTRAYKRAYANQRVKRASRTKRDTVEAPVVSPVATGDGAPRPAVEPTVKIHNIRSSLPEPEIEMIYTVYKGTPKSLSVPQGGLL